METFKIENLDGADKEFDFPGDDSIEKFVDKMLEQTEKDNKKIKE